MGLFIPPNVSARDGRLTTIPGASQLVGKDGKVLGVVGDQYELVTPAAGGGGGFAAPIGTANIQSTLGTLYHRGSDQGGLDVDALTYDPPFTMDGDDPAPGLSSWCGVDGRFVTLTPGWYDAELMIHAAWDDPAKVAKGAQLDIAISGATTQFLDYYFDIVPPTAIETGPSTGIKGLAATASSTEPAQSPVESIIDGRVGVGTPNWQSVGIPSASTPEWVRFTRGAAFVANTYQITIPANGAGTVANAPKDFTIQGSNDGNAWTTLDTQTAFVWTTDGQRNSWVLPNTTAYLYYRLSCTATAGAAAFSLSELEFNGQTNPGVYVPAPARYGFYARRAYGAFNYQGAGFGIDIRLGYETFDTARVQALGIAYGFAKINWVIRKWA